MEVLTQNVGSVWSVPVLKVQAKITRQEFLCHSIWGRFQTTDSIEHCGDQVLDFGYVLI
jgi:hypothetical protein